MEHRRVGRVELVGAEDPSRAGDVDRRLARQHRARLNGRRVCAQHHRRPLGSDPERVLHRAGRVVRAEVEGVEVEPFGLDLGTLGDLPAHRDEDVGDVLRQRRDGVAGADAAATSHGSVTSTASVTSARSSSAASTSAVLAASAWLIAPAGLADSLAGLLACLRRQCADLAVGQRQRRAVTDVIDAHLLERIERLGGGDRGQGLVAHALDLIGVQRSDLHGVVRGIGRGHSRPDFRMARFPDASGPRGQSRDAPRGVVIRISRSSCRAR